MRILRAFTVFFIVIASLGVLTFLISREVLLLMAVSQVRSSVNTLRRTASNTGTYAQQCRELGLIDDTIAAVDSVQLRFDSPTSYVLEVTCAQFSLSPIIIDSKKLPPFAQKTIGSSGLIWNQDLSGIGIEVWGRSRGIFVEAGDIWYDSIDKTVGLPGPITSCSGHGYSCCQIETSQGIGGTISHVTDCPRSCYEQCQLRPLVLSLSSQPFYDPATRTLIINSGDPIEVGYVIDSQGSKELQVSLDFGDGTIEQFTEFQGRSSHTYACRADGCEYTITLTATNEDEIVSAVTSISQILVKVRGQ